MSRKAPESCEKIPVLMGQASKAIDENSIPRPLLGDLRGHLIRTVDREFRGRFNSLITTNPDVALARLLRSSLGEGVYGLQPAIERRMLVALIAHPNRLDLRETLYAIIEMHLYAFIFEELHERAAPNPDAG